MTPREKVSEEGIEVPRAYIIKMEGKPPDQLASAVVHLEEGKGVGSPEEQALRDGKLVVLRRRLGEFARLAAKGPEEIQESMYVRRRLIAQKQETPRIRAEFEFLKERERIFNRLGKKSPGGIQGSIDYREKKLGKMDWAENPIACVSTEAELEFLREKMDRLSGGLYSDVQELAEQKDKMKKDDWVLALRKAAGIEDDEVREVIKEELEGLIKDNEMLSAGRRAFEKERRKIESTEKGRKGRKEKRREIGRAHV